jgi:hypothetical protein
MQIELRDSDIERIQEVCCETAAHIAIATIDAKIEKSIKAAIEDRMKALADEALRPIVEGLVANGWPRTNSYGERNGTITLQQRVTEVLFPNSNYDSPSQKIMREVLDKELKGELGALLTTVKLKLVEMLEGDILDRLRGYLRDGLQLKK